MSERKREGGKDKGMEKERVGKGERERAYFRSVVYSPDTCNSPC